MAILLNLFCIAAVIARRRRIEEDVAVEKYSRWVRLSGIGVPFAGIAAYIGLVYFR